MKSNLILALNAYDIIKKDKSLRNLKVLGSIRKMLQDIKSGTFEKVDVDKKRTVINLKRAILGDKDSVIVDCRMNKAYNIDRYHLCGDKFFECSPTNSEHNFIQDHILSLSRRTNFEARQIASMISAGVESENGKFKDLETRKVLESIL